MAERADASRTHQPSDFGDAFLEVVHVLESLVEHSPNDPKYLFEWADTLTHASRTPTDADADAEERFLQEARAAAAVRYENVVSIFQVGREQRNPVPGQELLHGESLDARPKRGD